MITTTRSRVATFDRIFKGHRASYLAILSVCLVVSSLLVFYGFTSASGWQDEWTRWAGGSISSEIVTQIVPASVSSFESPTRWTGDVPGYMVFENLWYHDKVFYYQGNASDMASIPEDVIHAPVSLRRTDSIRDLFPAQNASMTVQGSTIFLNDHPDVYPMLLAWFYHFASEEILGALAALSAADPPTLKLTPDMEILEENTIIKRGQTVSGAIASGGLPDRVIIPWVPAWRDPYGLNEAFASGVWRDGVMEPEEWANLEQEGWLHFEKIVIVDRQAAGRAPLSSKWNKMALEVFSHPHPADFFEPVRSAFLSSLAIPVRTRLSADDTTIDDMAHRPVQIVYVDRQATNRRLSDESHQAVMRVLNRLAEEGKVVWTHGKFGEVEIRRQVEVTAAADILIGVHGNGLTHQLWMAPGGSVVEIFPEGTFTRDYQVLAETVGHDHYFFRNASILPREKWENMVSEQHPEPLYDGTQITLDEAFLLDFMTNLIRGP